MKKAIAITLLLGATLIAGAQGSRFTMGSKFGFGSSYIKSSSSGVFHPSWVVGLATEYKMGEHLGLGVDILYSSEGARYRTRDVTVNTEIDYLRVPIRIMYNMGESTSSFRPRVYAGPTPGILFAEGTGYKDFDIGLNAGAGFAYQLYSDFWLTADLDYYHGLTDIYAGTTDKEMNRNIRVNIGLMFSF
jgi:hypothetical protein